MGKLTVSKETLQKMKPRSSNYQAPFPIDKPIVMIALHEKPEDLVDWGTQKVPTIELDGGTKVPAPRILNSMIIPVEGVLKNEGKTITVDEKERSLECADFVGNTLHDYLTKQMEKSESGQIDLPAKIIPKKQVNKGIRFDSVTSETKKNIYEDSYYVPDGETFETGLGDFEFIPSIYKSTVGTLRNNTCFIINPLD